MKERDCCGAVLEHFAPTVQGVLERAGVRVWRMPGHLSQSRLGDRVVSSNACTIIAQSWNQVLALVDSHSHGRSQGAFFAAAHFSRLLSFCDWVMEQVFPESNGKPDKEQEFEISIIEHVGPRRQTSGRKRLRQLNVGNLPHSRMNFDAPPEKASSPERKGKIFLPHQDLKRRLDDWDDDSGTLSARWRSSENEPVADAPGLTPMKLIRLGSVSPG